MDKNRNYLVLSLNSSQLKNLKIIKIIKNYVVKAFTNLFLKSLILILIILFFRFSKI